MEDELKRFASVHEQQEEEYARMANDFQGLSFSPGHQSEPATPPEYREPGNSSIYPNRNRYSSASLTSPPGMSQRLSRSGSQVTSPPSESAQSRDYENEADKLPSKSVPASRRGSSDRFSQYLPETGGFNQRTAARYVFRWIVPIIIIPTSVLGVFLVCALASAFCNTSFRSARFRALQSEGPRAWPFDSITTPFDFRDMLTDPLATGTPCRLTFQ